MAIFVGRTVQSFKESPQFKIAFYHKFTKHLKQVQTDRSYFSQATLNWEHYGCPKQSFICTIGVWKIYTQVVVPKPFVNADRPMLDNLAAALEYSSYSVSTGRIDLSPAQKAIGVTTSTHFVLSRPRDEGPLPWSMLRACVWRCFEYPHIGKKCMNRIPNCLEIQWFFLHWEVTTQFPS